MALNEMNTGAGKNSKKKLLHNSDQGFEEI